MTTTASAHPNIALIKYWGKQPVPGNIPATPSLSITLDTLESVTSVDEAAEDTLLLNGEARSDAKIASYLDLLRQNFDVPPLKIETSNNFPTAAGLASSASGFAALTTAIDQHCDLQMSLDQRSDYAGRRPSLPPRACPARRTPLPFTTTGSLPLGKITWPHTSQ
jgi:diphosphomevalonate decarboxylase